MKTLIQIITHFFKLTFNKKIKYPIYFLLPVVIVVAAFLLFGSSSSGGVTLGYTNNDTGTLGRDLIAYLENTGKNRLIPVAAEKCDKEILDGKIHLALLIPPGFSGSVLSGEKPEVQLISLQGEAVAAYAEGDINQFINSIRSLVKTAGGDQALFSGMYSAFLNSAYTLQVSSIADSGTRKEGGARGIGFLIFFLSVQAVMITGLLLKEKQERTFFRILTAPVRELTYTIANTLAAFIILFVQILLTLLIVVYILRIDLSVPVGYLIPVLSAFSMVAISLGLLVTALTRSTLQAALLANLIINLSGMLGGCFWPLRFMPDFMQKIAVVLPQSWAMQALEKLQNGAAFSSVGLSLLLLLGFSALFISLYAFKMKHNKNTGNFI